MDSSRSGLLSTFLMTLPLIIVPAIALLRPPGQTSGISDTVAQSAEAEEFGFPTEFAEADKPEESSASPDEMNAEFGFPTDIAESDSSQKPTPKKRRSSQKTEENDDIFSAPDDRPGTRGPTGKEIPAGPAPKAAPSVPDTETPPQSSDGPASETVVRQLNAMGAIRTLWFDAGETSPVGFAAFFRGDTDLMRYRFEAVGQTRTECAEDVLKQVTQWRTAAAAK
jgi:hypothetical protein